MSTENLKVRRDLVGYRIIRNKNRCYEECFPCSNVQPSRDLGSVEVCIITLKNVKKRRIPGLRKRLETFQEVVCPMKLSVRSVEGLTCL
jgi:hypothetical protein